MVEEHSAFISQLDMEISRIPIHKRNSFLHTLLIILIIKFIVFKILWAAKPIFDNRAVTGAGEAFTKLKHTHTN